MDYTLDIQQQKAARTMQGQVLVIACPGSGKTTVIIERVHNLTTKVNPASILVITFTKAAAEEMKNRYKKKYGETKVVFCTIHSICYSIIKREFGLDASNILKDAEQYEFFRGYLINRVSGVDLDEYIKDLLLEISYVRNSRTKPELFESKKCSSSEFVEYMKAYAAYKTEENKIDFDDMLIICRQTLIHKPDVLAYWKKKYPYIMIDEYQDTNRIQADIFLMLAGKNGNLFVVGDDDQSIYGFRSADSSIMLDFGKWYPACTKIELNTNYRSAENIIEVASNLIQKNTVRYQKQIIGKRKERGEVILSSFENTYEQAKAIISDIKTKHSRGVPYNEIAILYRCNVQNLLLVSLLLSREKDQIPFYTTEIPKDIHNEFIFADLMTYWRLAEGSWKKGDLQRILNRPGRYLKAEVFKNCPFELNEMLQRCKNLPNKENAKNNVFDLFWQIKKLKGKKPTEFISYIMNTMRYKEWLHTYCEYIGKEEEALFGIIDVLQKEASQFQTMQDWYDYSQFYAMKLQEMKRNPETSGVCLSTFHSAKGLEWKNVFVIDCNEEVTPSKKAQSPEEYEEERRLFYVAITRAKDELNLMYVKHNEDMSMDPSRYLYEMGLFKQGKEKSSVNEPKGIPKVRGIKGKLFPISKYKI